MAGDDKAARPIRLTPQQITSIVYRHWLGQIRSDPQMGGDLVYKEEFFYWDRQHVESTNADR